MRILLTLRDSDIFAGSKNCDPSKFSLRHAARAVLLNDKGHVALLKVSAGHYHKLPGGGVEATEHMQATLERELLEEVGCHIRVVQELGQIIEYKNEHREKQISRCWLTLQVGQAVAPSFTKEEMRDGFQILWADNVAHAIALLAQDKPTEYTGKFIQQRDGQFLKVAQTLLQSW